MHGNDGNSAMDKVRATFAASGMAMRDLGIRMGYPEKSARKSAWQFIHDTNDPRLSTLCRFAKAMNVPLAELTGEVLCPALASIGEERIAEGDLLFAGGKTEEAIQRYKAAYNVSFVRSRECIARIVVHELSAGHEDEARRWVDRALDSKLDVDFEMQAAKSMLALARREHDKREARARRQKEEREREEQEKPPIAATIVPPESLNTMEELHNMRIAHADALFLAGKEREAVEIYKSVYMFWFVGNCDRIGRIVEYDLRAGRIHSAWQWAHRAIDSNSEVEFETQTAKDLLMQVRRERGLAAKSMQGIARRNRDEEATIDMKEANREREGINTKDNSPAGT
jgi:transcriptional regulator with XRE-family HTH domain